MNLTSIFDWLSPRSKPARSRAKAQPFQPRFETLEDRVVPTWSVNNVSPAALVQSLTGGADRVSNIQYFGATVAEGTFYDTQNVTGIQSGIILSTGVAKGIAGPNNNAGLTNVNGTNSDPQVDNILNPVSGFDASVLQFTWTPSGRYATFSFVFGSEEYPAFAPPNVTPFTVGDAFGLFVNGVNQAHVPGTATTIKTDNINSATNSTFFVDNFGNPAGPIFGTHNTQMNGYTTVITVNLNLTPGVPNFIKLGIEDGFDATNDSWVLIKAGSLRSFNVPVLAPIRYNYAPATATFSGDFYVVNPTNVNLPASNFLIFLSLPPGVTITNATGTTPSGHPYIDLGSIGGSASIRVRVNLLNPLRVNLGTTLNHSPIIVSTVLI